jgi:hypothetical protein
MTITPSILKASLFSIPKKWLLTLSVKDYSSQCYILKENAKNNVSGNYPQEK